MRKGVVFLLLFLIFPNFIFAQSSSSEKIEEFSVEITINKDSSFLVKEKIIYDFGENLKHGIYRDIPLKGIKIKVLEVVDETGHPYLFEVSKIKGSSLFNPSTRKYLRIKIGNPQEYVSGKKTYLITYRVENGLGYFKDHDELYWNVTGNEWNVPIERVTATIHLPKKISESELKFDCFTGFFGSKEKHCNFRLEENEKIYFESEKTLFPGEGWSVVVGFPKKIVKEPAFIQKFFWYFREFGPFFIPIFVFLYLFKEWWQKGRDPRIKKTIITQYEPPDNLRPAQVSLIIKQKIEPIDISATLVDLAVRGYIKIREIKKTGIFGGTDYELIKLKDFDDPKENLWEYERMLLNKIFQAKNKKESLANISAQSTIYLSDLKDKFSKELKDIINKIDEETSSLGYFVTPLQKPREKWMWFGLIFLILTWILFIVSILDLGVITLVSAILFLIFAFFMPKRTEKGTEVYWHALGFKENINTAEKYRTQFYAKENIFEKYLPYTIIFGLVDKWARSFEGIYNKPPSWYE